MLKIENLLIFLFVWSLLVVIRTAFLAVSSVLSNEPKPIKLSKLELLLNSITISYIITYLIS